MDGIVLGAIKGERLTSRSVRNDRAFLPCYGVGRRQVGWVYTTGSGEGIKDETDRGIAGASGSGSGVRAACARAANERGGI